MCLGLHTESSGLWLLQLPKRRRALLAFLKEGKGSCNKEAQLNSASQRDTYATMVDYRRMGIMEEHLVNTTATISSHQLRDLWESPRGTVLRIQALTMVAIIFSFFLAAYGSCRRWSNSWIVQKGFFAAQVLSLSLGTYSIGLMQSSSVTSEMYPIWTVSLFTLFGCIDPVTTYNGLDYKGQLSKVVFGICLHCGYVLLMSISTISTVVGNTAIGMLSAITFIKGFHRSLSLVQQRRMRNKVQSLLDGFGHGYVLKYDPSIERIRRDSMVVSFATGIDGSTDLGLSQVEDALPSLESKGTKKGWLWSCYDVCVAMSLSHHLQRHVLGLGYREPRPEMLKGTKYEWALKVVETELALVYDYFYTGDPFIHYYQAKTASLCALASFIGICFVGVAVAIPGTMSSHRHTTSGSGAGGVVNTTTADLVVTFVILVFLALLQLMHLIRSWTSNWARVAVASEYSTIVQKIIWSRGAYKTPWWRTWWMSLKVSVATSSNWFDKYLWQDKIGQYSVLPEGRLTDGKKGEEISSRKECKSPVSSSIISITLGENGEGSSSRKECNSAVSNSSTTSMTAGNNTEGGSSSSSRKDSKSIVKRLASIVGFLYKKCARLVLTLGLDYIWEVLWDLLGSDTNKRPAVKLDDEVKDSIVKFLDKIETDRLDGNWFLSLSKNHPIGIRSFIPSPDTEAEKEPHGYRYTECVMKLHIVTWYCELKEQEPKQENRNRHVANALSKYCAYLVESVPELLPGPVPETKSAYDEFKKAARMVVGRDKESRWFFGKRKKNKEKFLAGALSDPETWISRKWNGKDHMDPRFQGALYLAKELMDLGDDGSRHSDPWDTLVQVWVRLLVYAAPYGNVEMHMRRLSQGGEFITHLWTLLYHLDIRKWKSSPHNLKSLTTIDDAEAILANDKIEMAVVAFISSPSLLQEGYSDEIANAAKLERGAKFYETSSPAVAKLFHIDPAARNKALIFLNKMAEQKFTLYDGKFRAYDIGYFVATAKKPACDKTRAQGTAPTIPDSAIKKQSLEDGGQTEDQNSVDEHGEITSMTS